MSATGPIHDWKEKRLASPVCPICKHHDVRIRKDGRAYCRRCHKLIEPVWPTEHHESKGSGQIASQPYHRGLAGWPGRKKGTPGDR